MAEINNSKDSVLTVFWINESQALSPTQTYTTSKSRMAALLERASFPSCLTTEGWIGTRVVIGMWTGHVGRAEKLLRVSESRYGLLLRRLHVHVHGHLFLLRGSHLADSCEWRSLLLLSVSLRVIINPEDVCSTSAVAHNLAAPIKARSRTFSLRFPLCLLHTSLVFMLSFH